jgi:hypothetical protein
VKTEKKENELLETKANRSLTERKYGVGGFHPVPSKTRHASKDTSASKDFRVKILATDRPTDACLQSSFLMVRCCLPRPLPTFDHVRATPVIEGGMIEG